MHHDKISSVSSRMSQRIISALETDEGEALEVQLELDSHADSPVLGIHAHIVSYTGNYVKVSGFVDSLGKKKCVPIVDAVIAYDCDVTGNSSLMYICNALYIPEMKYHLMHPFLMCLAGILVDECPKFLAKRVSINNHSVFFPDKNIRIPLFLRGIISYFPCRRATSDELNDNSMLVLDLTPIVLDLTPIASEWNPHDAKYSDLEASMIDYKGEIREQGEISNHQLMSIGVAGCEPVLKELNRCLDVGSFAADLQVVASVGTYDWKQTMGYDVGEQSEARNNISGVNSSRRRGSVDAQELAELWKIGLAAAKRTLDTCTQLLVRSSQDPTLNKRFSSSDQCRRYSNQVAANVFMDTFFTSQPERRGSKGGTRSQRGFGCAQQVFITDFNHTHVLVPLHKKEDVPFAVKS